jgi:hypothetical protein
MSPQTAEKLGYAKLTVAIHPIREAAIFDSVQKSLRTCDAVWIEIPGNYFVAGRKKSDLKTLTEGDAR